MALSAANGLKSVIEKMVVGVNHPATRTLDSDKRTALHWAAKGGHESIVVHFLDLKANIEAKNIVRKSCARL